MLRDSGDLQILTSKQVVKSIEFKDTNEDRLMQGVIGDPVKIPLVEIQIESDLVNGIIKCGLTEKLPPGIYI